MTALACTAEMPQSGLEWRQWVRRMIEELELPSSEAHLLTVLGDRASSAGTIRLGVPLLARQLGGISESQVYRRLAALTRRGLLRTRQQGRRLAVRELVAVAAPVQLSLFDAPTEPAAPAPPPSPVVAAWPTAPAAVRPRMDACSPSHQREAAVDGQVEKKETRAASDTRSTIRSRSGVLAPRLVEVLEILEPAIGPIVEPMAFQSALAAFPEDRGHDHVQAAHILASYGFEGEARSPVSLLRQILRNQTQRAPGRWHGGRRRPAAPTVSAAMQEQTDRETETMRRFMAQAGFGART